MDEPTHVTFDDESWQDSPLPVHSSVGRPGAGLVGLVMKLGLAKSSQKAVRILLVVAALFIVLTIIVSISSLKDDTKASIEELPPGIIPS